MATGYRSYFQLLLVLVGLTVALLLPGYVVTRKLGGPEAVAGMIWGCGLSLLASAAGGLPQILVSRSPQEAGTFALGSLAIRMGITLFGALVIALATDVPKTPFLLWVAASYLVFLVADVIFALRAQPSGIDRTP